MKWMRFCSAVFATLSVATMAEASVIQQVGCCGAQKSCGCAPLAQPCCQPKIFYKPVVCRPTTPSVHTYQRQCCKPASCDTCAPPRVSCGPRRLFGKKHCCNAGCPTGCNQGCAPAAPACAAPAPACAAPAPACAAPAPAPAAPACAAPAPACAAPAPAPACAPAAPACAAPAPAAVPGCAAPAPACAAPAPAPARPCGPVPAPVARPCGPVPAAHACGPTCNVGCKTGCCPTTCCNADPCEVAHWIYVSQTACYAKDRRRALRRLGNFNCVCNPEIMCAFIYGLNDADERVRAQAACEIHGQVKKHPCCCNEKVTSALICALGDCDRKVRRGAERALVACGYEVANCNTFLACNTGCGVAAPACGVAAPACGVAAPAAVAPPAAAPMYEEAAPAPAPPAAEPEAYFPSRLRDQQTRKAPVRNSLANLFGMRN